jgi:hypothetical protein
MSDTELDDFVEARMKEDLDRYAAGAAFNKTIVDMHRHFTSAAAASPQDIGLGAQATVLGALVETMSNLWGDHPEFRTDWGMRDG